MPQRHKQLHGGDFSNYTCPQRVTKLAQDNPREAKTGESYYKRENMDK